jgi:hypothetical protein
MVGSLLFAAVAAAVVGVSTWAVVRLQRKELAGSKAEFDTYKLETAKRIAEANLQATLQRPMRPKLMNAH